MFIHTESLLNSTVAELTSASLTTQFNSYVD